MGSITYVTDFDLKVSDPQGLQNWLNDKTVPQYVKDCEGEYEFDNPAKTYENNKDFLRKMMSNAPRTEIAIEDFFTESKIIGYWYSGWVMLVRDLAQFVRGNIDLMHEMGERWRIEFEGGEMKLREGIVDYNKMKARSPEQIANIEELPDKEKVFRGL